MSKATHHHSPAQEDSAVLLRRAARERQRGHLRRAMALYKRAAFDEGDRPGLWTRYALSCMSIGHIADAARAFSQAVWLLERQGRKRGAAVTQELAEVARAGRLPDNYASPSKARRRSTAWRVAASCTFARQHTAQPCASQP
jgi:hypothetical protein